ncbi:MAG: flagellar basal body rod protein FlgC [Bacillota bacterium]|nr:flagellar basal body rod protein FlgC [Bacillota bacterium]
MRFLNSIDVSASGMTAQRLKMDSIASNMANVESTRTSEGKGPYRRQVVVFEARGKMEPGHDFSEVLNRKIQTTTAGVRVKEIRSLDDNEAPFRKVYDPSHPDADEKGYASYPNVNVVEEMINMIASSRAYEANSKVIESSKAMAMRALQLGR